MKPSGCCFVFPCPVIGAYEIHNECGSYGYQITDEIMDPKYAGKYE